MNLQFHILGRNELAHVHPDELQASAVHTQNENEPEFDNEQVISERTLSTEESQEFLENEKIEYEGVDFLCLKILILNSRPLMLIIQAVQILLQTLIRKLGNTNPFYGKPCSRGTYEGI